jgi:hypothetical protein
VVDYNIALRPLQIVTNGNHTLSFRVGPESSDITVIFDFPKSTWRVNNCMDEHVKMSRATSNEPMQAILCTVEKTDLDLRVNCEGNEAGRLAFHSSNKTDCVKDWVGLTETNLKFVDFDGDDFYRASQGYLL